MNTKWPNGTYEVDAFKGTDVYDDPDVPFVTVGDTRWAPNQVESPCGFEQFATAFLFAASPKLYSEMERYLPILERLAACPKLWVQLTEGTGIATLNGYKHAMSLARNEITPNP